MNPESKLTQLKETATIADTFRPAKGCCLNTVADRFTSVPGFRTSCGFCGNTVKGVLAKTLKAEQFGMNFSSIRPSLSVMPDMDVQSFFFHPKWFSVEKIMIVAENHGLCADNCKETSEGFYLQINPGSWYESESVIVKQISKGALAIFAHRKNDCRDLKTASSSDFGEDPVWWI